MRTGILRSTASHCGCAKPGGHCACAKSEPKPQFKPDYSSGSYSRGTGEVSTTPTPIGAARSFDFAKISVNAPQVPAPFFDGKSAQAKAGDAPAKTAPTPRGCYDKCGGQEYGSFECKLGPDGLPTATVDVIIREKDPCVAPCVKEHEQRHVRDLTPVCSKVASCLKHARGNESKQDACLDAYESSVKQTKNGTECAAYQVELDCLARRAGTSACKNNPKLKEHVALAHCYHDCFCA